MIYFNTTYKWSRRALAMVSVLLVFGFLLQLSNINAQTAEAVKISFRVNENNQQVESLNIEPGEIVYIKVYVSDAQQMDAISGKVVLPSENFTVVNIQQQFGICSAWDSVPEVRAGAIEFTCAQGPLRASSGVIMTIKAVVNTSFQADRLGFSDIVYLSADRDTRELEHSELRLQLPRVAQASAVVDQAQQAPNTMVLLVNFVLIVGVILSLVMGYRYYQSNKQYAN